MIGHAGKGHGRQYIQYGERAHAFAGDAQHVQAVRANKRHFGLAVHVEIIEEPCTPQARRLCQSRGAGLGARFDVSTRVFQFIHPGIIIAAHDAPVSGREKVDPVLPQIRLGLFVDPRHRNRVVRVEGRFSPQDDVRGQHEIGASVAVDIGLPVIGSHGARQRIHRPHLDARDLARDERRCERPHRRRHKDHGQAKAAHPLRFLRENTAIAMAVHSIMLRTDVPASQYMVAEFHGVASASHRS